MIVFQTFDGLYIDLTEHGLTFNESSPYFSTETESSYTYPFTASLDSDIAVKFGIVSQENITSYTRRIDGYLIVDNSFYDAYLKIAEVNQFTIELRLFYGTEVLSVFNKKMTELPFPIIDTADDLNNFSQQALSRSWPEVTHNFPNVWRPQISEQSDYGYFNGYVNLRTADNASLIRNSTTTVDGESQPYNYNVLAPMPYLLEVLKVAFATEGLAIRGEFVDHPLFQKTLLIPTKYFEYYSDSAIRTTYNFGTSGNTLNGKQTFSRTHQTSKNGTYYVHARINFPKGLTQNFNFSITHNGVEHYSASAGSETINIDEIVEINVENDEFAQVEVKLIIDTQQRSIAGYTNFVFDYKDGRVNVFPNTYSLKEVMPDISFRTFFDALVKWANLEVAYLPGAVYINFMENTLKNLVYEDLAAYEDPKRKRVLSANNLFKLLYKDEKEVLVANSGQVYDDSDYTTSEIKKIAFDVLPVNVIQTNDIMTGNWPDEEAEIVLGIYDGLQSGRPTLIKEVGGIDLGLQSIYENFHKLWLSFRANAETYKDTFFAPVSQLFNLRKGVFKYNKKHLIKKIRKRRVNARYWKVDMETETL